MNLFVEIKEKLADTETPVSAYNKLCRAVPDSFLLESVETHESVGRYSIIAFDPISSLTLWPDKVSQIEEGGAVDRPAEDFFNIVRQSLERYELNNEHGLPAVGSFMGFVGFDAVRLIEELGPAPDASLPIARLVFPSRFVIFDNVRRIMTLVGIAENSEDCMAKIRDTESGLKQITALEHPKGKVEITAPPQERYMQAVSKAKEYIKAGDIFQVVLADRFIGKTDVDPFNFYRCLRVKSPSPYMFYLNFGDYQLAGASPETMVKVVGGKVTLRPIAGTRGRSDDPETDLALEKELMASEKERAEHIMLVDLARNDAGRVSTHGTVSITPYMTVERYSHVMHIVSQVHGRLAEDCHAVDAFMAGFPAGTVSGAPKVRAMEIIDELESGPRGPYSGAVGYFGPGNATDTCIGIRMVLFEKDRFTIPVGAGIVADSDPEMEYREIEHKAAQSIHALKTAAEGEL